MVGKQPATSRNAQFMLAPIHGKSDCVICVQPAAVIVDTWFTNARILCVQHLDWWMPVHGVMHVSAERIKGGCISCPASAEPIIEDVYSHCCAGAWLHSHGSLPKLFCKQQCFGDWTQVAANWAVLSLLCLRAHQHLRKCNCCTGQCLHSSTWLVS